MSVQKATQDFARISNLQRSFLKEMQGRLALQFRKLRRDSLQPK
jgi:hypothetical protein